MSKLSYLFALFIFISTVTLSEETLARGNHCETVAQDTQFGPFTLCASSVLPPQGKNRYTPGKAGDSNPKTAWVEGVKGHGQGEWLELDLQGKSQFQTLFIVNGYTKSRKAFVNNSRVRVMRVQAADGLDIKVRLKDSMSEQEIRLPRKVITPWLRMTIVSVYPGKRWQDTAITEAWVDLEEFNYSDMAEQPDSAEGQGAYTMSENGALNKIMAIEEIRSWADNVGKAGNSVSWQTDRTPKAGCTGNDCLWCFRFIEEKESYNTTFGTYCIDNNSRTSRFDPVMERLVSLEPTATLSLNEILRTMPNKMQGWLKWRDRENIHDMSISWNNRQSRQNEAEFNGIVSYRSRKTGRTTKAALRMRINPQSRSVVMDEKELKKQADFDTSGRFYGELQQDNQSVIGEWRKAGYSRIADFSIY